MQSIHAFLDIAKFADFRWKIDDFSRTADVSRDLYIFWIFFGYSITVPRFMIEGYVWQILGRGGRFCPSPPIRERPRKSPSWIGLKYDTLYFYSNNFEFIPSRANLLLWFSWVFFQIIWSKLPPFEEILSPTFDCCRKERF